MVNEMPNTEIDFCGIDEVSGFVQIQIVQQN